MAAGSGLPVPATGAAALLGAVLLAVGVGYRVRYSPAASGATWADAQDVGTVSGGTRISLPARAGSYLVKAADELGYPLILRPNYTLGGGGGIAAQHDRDDERHLDDGDGDGQ